MFLTLVVKTQNEYNESVNYIMRWARIRVVEVIDEEKGVQECAKDGVPRSI